MPTICSVPSCSHLAYARTYCDPHYRRWLKYGDPDADLPLYHRYAPPAERFARRVVEGPPPAIDPALGPCLLWTGCRKAAGYGRFSVDRRTVNAHRFAYEFVHGPIAAGLVLDHLCCVTNCVRVSHLEPVTNVENLRRGKERMKNGRLGDSDGTGANRSPGVAVATESLSRPL